MKVLSRDSVTVTVDAVIYYRVSNPTMVFHIIMLFSHHSHIVIIIIIFTHKVSNPTMVSHHLCYGPLKVSSEIALRKLNEQKDIFTIWENFVPGLFFSNRMVLHLVMVAQIKKFQQTEISVKNSVWGPVE